MQEGRLSLTASIPFAPENQEAYAKASAVVTEAKAEIEKLGLTVEVGATVVNPRKPKAKPIPVPDAPYPEQQTQNAFSVGGTA